MVHAHAVLIAGILLTNSLGQSAAVSIPLPLLQKQREQLQGPGGASFEIGGIAQQRFEKRPRSGTSKEQHEHQRQKPIRRIVKYKRHGPSATFQSSACSEASTACPCEPTQPHATSYATVTTTAEITMTKTVTKLSATSGTALHASSGTPQGSKTRNSSTEGLSHATGASTTSVITRAPTSTRSATAAVATLSNHTSATSSRSTPSSMAEACPAGTKWSTFSDNFAKWDPTKWEHQSGPDTSSSFGPNGLQMSLSKDVQNIVYQSCNQWKPPVSMSVSMKTTNAPAVVHCAIFKNADASDEIDLELIEGGWDVPMWKDGQRLEFGRDLNGQLASSSINHTAWKYYDKAAVPWERVIDWTVNWTNSTLSWSADGKKLFEGKAIPGKKWPDEALHVRFGPWIAGDWAGNADWKQHPNPVQQITNVHVEGCMVI